MSFCGINKVDEWNTLPPVQSSVNSSQYIEVPCYTSLPREDQTSLEFRIDKTDAAIDPSSIFMHLRVQILNADGTKYTTDSKKVDKKEVPGTTVAPVNLLAYSLFSSVEVNISDQRINPGSSHYPWMCYVLNLLYQSPEAKASSLKAAGWYPDDSFFHDIVKWGKNNINNRGFVSRVHLGVNSKEIDLVSRVIFDTQFPARVLPVHTDFMLRFNRTDPNLCLMAADKAFRIRISDAKLYALKMRLTDQALQRQNQMLNGGVNYPMVFYDTRTITMMKGAQNLDWVPVSGVVPQKIYIWQITQEAFNGKINKNPFNLQTFDLSKLQVLVNEQSMITSQPTTYATGNRHMMYMNTIMNTTEAAMDPTEFNGGYFISVIDLTRDHSAGCNYVSDPVTGNLRIIIDYENPLKESIVVFCMSEFTNTLRIDANRNPQWIS